MLELEKISPSVHTLDNGICVYGYPDDTADLIRIEFIFNAGGRYAENPLVSQACVSLLTKGTHNKTGGQVAEEFDYYGAYTDKLSDKDTISFTVHSLSRNLDTLIDLCAEIFVHSVFSQNEIDIYLQKNYQKFLISKQKVSDVSRRQLLKKIFGDKHPYGVCTTDEDFKTLRREDLLDFYGKRIVSGLSAIVIAGTYNEKIIKKLNALFGTGNFNRNGIISEGADYPQNTDTAPLEPHFISMPSSVQTSLRMGMLSPIPAVRDEFYPLKTLDFIFGGYFGSRLSKNIREEKGYTYGISSYIISMRSTGLWQISSEIKKGAAEKVLKEIEKEKEKLCNDLISEKELTLVKNCFWGEMLRTVDSVFDKAERKRFLVNMSIDETHYKILWETVNSTTPATVRDTAQKYFSADNFVKIIVGE
ncbi:MAG: insulinase family protein [Bacteroidales bacterium]|jgi:predicted Zn-dependent peptidase|nr:insulinase family protein [Bacteroidales bacterium]